MVNLLSDTANMGIAKWLGRRLHENRHKCALLTNSSVRSYIGRIRMGNQRFFVKNMNMGTALVSSIENATITLCSTLNSALEVPSAESGDSETCAVMYIWF